jgi:ABC-type phosphate transport system substrate-binding protein
MSKTLLISAWLLLVLAMPAQGLAEDIVVVMGAAATSLTKDQVANLYIGRSNDLKPLDLPESSPTREKFYLKATGRDPAQIKAVWSRITFTGQGLPPREVADAAAVKKAVNANPKAIGYIDKADVDASVKVVLTLN